MRSSQFFFFHNTSSPNFFSIKKHEIITATISDWRPPFATTDGFCLQPPMDSVLQSMTTGSRRSLQSLVDEFSQDYVFSCSYLFCSVQFGIPSKLKIEAPCVLEKLRDLRRSRIYYWIASKLQLLELRILSKKLKQTSFFLLEKRPLSRS